MKRNDYTGIGKVFRFTIVETVKARSFIITFVIMILAALFVMPVMTLLNKDNSSEEQGSKDQSAETVKNMYIINSTEIDTDGIIDALKEDDCFSSINLIASMETIESLENRINEEDYSDIICDLSLNSEEGYYKASIYYNKEQKQVDSSEVSFISKRFAEDFNQYKIDSIQSKSDAVEKINTEVFGVVNSWSEYVSDEASEGLSFSNYNIVYVMIFVYYMLIIMSSGVVSSKVAEEKTNRIVEYMLTTVRPMALILGKVFGTLLVSIVQFVIVNLCGRVSMAVAGKISENTAADILSQYLSKEALDNLNPLNICLCIIILALGIVIYALLAGLFGATVSKIEELAQGMQTYTFIIVISFLMDFVSLITMSKDVSNPYVMFSQLFPFTSVMILPATIIVGEASMTIIIVSLIIMIVSVFVIMKFVATVYESVIVSNGSPIKIKQMINIAFGRMNNGKKEALTNEK